jgi:hypothetical protein
MANWDSNTLADERLVACSGEGLDAASPCVRYYGRDRTRLAGSSDLRRVPERFRASFKNRPPRSYSLGIQIPRIKTAHGVSHDDGGGFKAFTICFRHGAVASRMHVHSIATLRSQQSILLIPTFNATILSIASCWSIQSFGGSWRLRPMRSFAMSQGSIERFLMPRSRYHHPSQ